MRHPRSRRRKSDRRDKLARKPYNRVIEARRSHHELHPGGWMPQCSTRGMTRRLPSLADYDGSPDRF